jgi:hypothetical protein
MACETGYFGPAFLPPGFLAAISSCQRKPSPFILFRCAHHQCLVLHRSEKRRASSRAESFFFRPPQSDVFSFDSFLPGLVLVEDVLIRPKAGLDSIFCAATQASGCK